MELKPVNRAKLRLKLAAVGSSGSVVVETAEPEVSPPKPNAVSERPTRLKRSSKKVNQELDEEAAKDKLLTKAEYEAKYNNPEYVAKYIEKQFGVKPAEKFKQALERYPKFSKYPWRLYHFIVMVGLKLDELKFSYENEILGGKRVDFFGTALEKVKSL